MSTIKRLLKQFLEKKLKSKNQSEFSIGKVMKNRSDRFCVR